MTFQEALIKKENYGNKVYNSGKEFNVIIVPNKFSELVNFLSNYNEDNYSDKDCMSFSTDSDYNTHLFMTKESLKRLLI